MSFDMRIIIVAENVSAYWGGEAILPLHYFRFLSRRGHDVWLVTHERVKKELQNTLSADLLVRVHFMADTWIHKLLFQMGKCIPHRLNVMTLETLMYLISERMIRSYVRDKVSAERIDIVHQPYPVSPKRPSMIYDVGAPVVIGPMNGGMTFPAGFSYLESGFEEYFVRWVRLCSEWANRLIPGKRKAAGLVVANQRTKEALPACCSPNIFCISENGVDFSAWDDEMKYRRNEEGSPLFVFMGRLVDWKNIDVLIEALVVVMGKADVHLAILGDGKERGRLESLVAHLGLEKHVQFMGFLAQTECSEWLQKSTALLLPSLYECGGAVVLEAMAMRKPVIATNWGGPADYITEQTGILIEPKSRDQMIKDFAIAMLRLIDNPKLCERMGMEGRKRVEKEFDWDKKIGVMEDIYQKAIDKYND